MPSSVKTVIQCLDIDVLSKSVDMDIPNQVALHMYGYKVDDRTKSLVPGLYDELRYPAAQVSYRNEAVYQRGLDEQNKQNKFEAYRITPEWKLLMQSIRMTKVPKR